jgi:hypothetical protein
MFSETEVTYITEELLAKNRKDIPFCEAYANTLIVYEGGGYDGCFWEPNYAIINEHGDKLIDIYSSGYAGFKGDIKKFQNYIEEIERGSSNYLKIIKITKHFMSNNWTEIVKNMIGANNCLAVLQKIEKLLSIDLYIDCSICKNDTQLKYLIESANLGYYTGDGGIGIVSTEYPICYECVCDNSCENCTEFDTDITFCQITDTYLCPYCLDKEKTQKEQEQEQEQEKTLQESFRTRGAEIDNSLLVNQLNFLQDPRNLSIESNTENSVVYWDKLGNPLINIVLCYIENIPEVLEELYNMLDPILKEQGIGYDSTSIESTHFRTREQLDTQPNTLLGLNSITNIPVCALIGHTETIQSKLLIIYMAIAKYLKEHLAINLEISSQIAETTLIV